MKSFIYLIALALCINTHAFSSDCVEIDDDKWLSCFKKDCGNFSDSLSSSEESTKTYDTICIVEETPEFFPESSIKIIIKYFAKSNFEITQIEANVCRTIQSLEDVSNPKTFIQMLFKCDFARNFFLRQKDWSETSKQMTIYLDGINFNK